jgi:hypothetical protein
VEAGGYQIQGQPDAKNKKRKKERWGMEPTPDLRHGVVQRLWNKE